MKIKRKAMAATTTANTGLLSDKSRRKNKNPEKIDYKCAVEELKELLPKSLIDLNNNDELAVLEAAVGYIKLLQTAVDEKYGE